MLAFFLSVDAGTENSIYRMNLELFFSKRCVIIYIFIVNFNSEKKNIFVDIFKCPVETRNNEAQPECGAGFYLFRLWKSEPFI